MTPLEECPSPNCETPPEAGRDGGIDGGELFNGEGGGDGSGGDEGSRGDEGGDEGSGGDGDVSQHYF
jgi:hypothetical protein